MYLPNDYLAHYGVLGMRWGIRRYQPYPKGSSGGREIGRAAKVKQRGSVQIIEPKRKIRKKIESATGIKGYSGDVEITDTEWRQIQKRRQDNKSKNIGKNYLTDDEIDFIDSNRKKRSEQLIKAREAANLQKEYMIAREKALREGSASDVMNYISSMSTQEIQNAVQRIEWTTKLSNLSERERKTAVDKIDSVMKSVKKGNDWVTTSLSVYKNMNEINKILDGLMKSVEASEKKPSKKGN